MARPKPFIPPRIVGKAELAAYLNRSVTWLNANLPALYAMGFPRPLPLFEQWDRQAVDRFLDRLGGELPISEANHTWEKGIGG